MGCLKANLDGSLTLLLARQARVVRRDHLVQVIVATRNILPRCSSTDESEALAFIDGAWLAKEWTNSAIMF
jgi:hypothetical protein